MQNGEHVLIFGQKMPGGRVQNSRGKNYSQSFY